MKIKKLSLSALLFTLYPSSVAFANPTVGPPDPASAFVFPIIAEIGVVIYLLRKYSFNKLRLSGALAIIHTVTYPAFFFTTASLKGSSVGDFAIIVGEVIITLIEGSSIYFMSKSKWLRPYPSGDLSFKRTILVSTIGNICSFLIPIVSLLFSPFIFLISITLPYTLPIYLFLIYLYLRQKSFIKSISLSKRRAFAGAFLITIVIYSLYFYYSRNVTSRSFASNETCSLSNEEAVSATHSLMKKLNIRYGTSPIVEDMSLSNVGYPGIRKLKDIRFEYDNGVMKGRFYVGCESGDVEQFNNFEAEKKEATVTTIKDGFDHQNIIEALAKQIGIPSDMHLEKVEKDSREDIWEGMFVRLKDGYRYELDNVTIGIWEKTGDIASYKKIYFGQSCPTKINIQENNAINMAETEFHKFLFGRARSHFNDLYEHEVQLIIIQPDRPEHGLSVGQIDRLPLTERPSRLAWVIRFYFTGGIKYQVITPMKRKASDADLVARRNLMRKLGNPPGSFEMRIDAGNGEILSVSETSHLKFFYRWLLPNYLI